MYFLFYVFIHSLAGDRPFWYFFANALVLLGLSAGLVYLVLLLGGTRTQAMFTALVFVLGGPAVESFYTLSKPEPMQLLYVLVSILVVARYGRSQGRWVRALAFVLASAALLLANLTKEASLVMVPISLGWLLLAGWGRKRLGDRPVLGIAAGYFTGSVLAALAFICLRARYSELGLPAGNYVGMYTFTLSRFLESAVRWAGWLVRDYSFLLPLVALWALWTIRRKELRQAPLLAGALVWTTGWIAVYLPWRLAEEYYLLAFAAGAALMVSIMLEQGLWALVEGPVILRTIAGVCLVLAAGLFLLLQVNNATNARVQLSVDAANAEMVAFLGEATPAQSLIVVNYQEPNEYLDEIGLHLRLLQGRADLDVEHFRSPEFVLGSASTQAVYLVAQNVGSVPSLHVRGVTEEGEALEMWNQAVLEDLEGRASSLFETERRFRMLSVDLPRFLCFLMPQKAYCTYARPIIDTREFTYGWTIFRVLGDVAEGDDSGWGGSADGPR
jgi:hypothetical protein